ncbi:alpha/beta hydrolase [Motilimonas sp. 1_MG-2023]|uniref:alpha/beta fold hydrolase n=1 Tax=Motilimonas sp. 1_MG-2023 TaxID=3062672 RepID=UPI0026E1BCE2|nr:alpha/beta hydrolase [Motilimonas sp. 1_MG-2023]MDO6527214.1 alpha/beta hydrolase [Motilimonas sp. 1_MG-2023]
MKVILLPGMDGTGLLFEPLAQQLSRRLDVEVVPLNDVSGDSYVELAQQIAKGIQGEKIILVAESYSGRIAYELCHILGERIVKVIFVASFISRPSSIARLSVLVPASFIQSKFMPDWLLNVSCFSGLGSQAQISLVNRAIDQAGSLKLKRRLSMMAVMDTPRDHLAIQAVYIRPIQDRLVDASAVHVLAKVFTQLDIEKVAGGHFIALAQPEECANIILRAAEL